MKYNCFAHRAKNQEIEQTYLPVEVKVTDSNGKQLTAGQEIGKPLLITFTLRTPQGSYLNFPSYSAYSRINSLPIF